MPWNTATFNALHIYILDNFIALFSFFAELLFNNKAVEWRSTVEPLKIMRSKSDESFSTFYQIRDKIVKERSCIKLHIYHIVENKDVYIIFYTFITCSMGFFWCHFWFLIPEAFLFFIRIFSRFWKMKRWKSVQWKPKISLGILRIIGS